MGVARFGTCFTMKVAMFLMLAFLGIASAGRLGGHDHHGEHHDDPHHDHPHPTEPSSEAILIDASFNGILTFDNHACVFRNGELRLRGNFLMIGENTDYTVQSGRATLRTGKSVSVDSGLFNVRLLEYADTRVLQRSLARAEITLDQLLRQTGPVPPQQGIYDVTSGVLSIDGVLKNIRAGLIIATASQVVSNAGGPPSRLVQGQFAQESSGFVPGQFGQGQFGTSSAQSGQGPFGQSSGQGPFGGSSGRGSGQFGGSSGQFGTSPGQSQFGQGSQPQGGRGSQFGGQGSSGQFGTSPGQSQFGQGSQPQFGGQGSSGQFRPSFGQEQVGQGTQTVTVTETAAHETSTVSRPVTLTKTQTRDDFVTITVPVYNVIAATITNIVKETVTVPEEQVIRSPVAGGVVVNTIPVSSQTVLTVSVRTTNYFVSTVVRQDTQYHSLFVTNYSIGTATVINPTTSTVVQTITRTGVSTVLNTSTVGSTVYVTVTTTISVGGPGPTVNSVGGGYY